MTDGITEAYSIPRNEDTIEVVIRLTPKDIKILSELGLFPRYSIETAILELIRTIPKLNNY